jgi:hypothetical protein
VSIVRTSDNENTVAHAFDAWGLNDVAQLIDSVADGEPPPGKTWQQMREAARLELRRLPRLMKLAQGIVNKYDRGQLTQAEAQALNGTTDEEY